MKKYLLLLIFVLSIWIFALSLANTDFLVKKTASWDETYTNNLQEITINNSLTFEISAIWWATSKDFQINLPEGFVYNNYSISWNCTTNITINSNNYFRYNFSWANNCISILNFSYTPTIAWNYSISILENQSTLIKTIFVWVTNNNTITKAYSLDQNNNWFIDWYELYFANNITNSSAFWNLTVWWQNTISYSWNNSSWVINFADNIFNSWELPQILSTTTIFWNILMLSNNSVSEEDLSKPILSKINNNSVIWTNTWYISTWSIVFDFSEKLHPISQSYFEIKNWNANVNWSFTLSWEKITFLPSSAFSVWNYDFNVLNWAKDYSDNLVGSWKIKTLVLTWNVVWNCSWLPSNASWNSVSSIVRYWDWNSWSPASLVWTYNTTTSNTECRFICNTWYTWNWSNCSSPGSWSSSWGGWGGWGWGWGWWWGFATTCIDSELECTLYNGSYIWLRKWWVSCDWWNLWKICSIPQTWSWTTNNETSTWTQNNTSNSWSIDTSWWWTNSDELNLENIKNYLLNNVNKWLFKMVNQLYSMINYEYIKFFVLTEINTKNNYENLLINYRDLFLNINSYILTKDKNLLIKAKDNYINFNKYHNLTKNLEDKYITKISKNWVIIYQTKIEKMKLVLSKVEKIIVWKYQKLLLDWKITNTKYQESIKNYNWFVLYLSIYQSDKTPLAKTYWKEFLIKVIEVYKSK